ncbi:hypothetical protein SDC9_121799 [bioreactor metagenome]|uniref:Uncharacterized protein n=1 Tax=bioreactor metagenome TaxID=1076179 RepID=A0A645CD15_9ZZZZ
METQHVLFPAFNTEKVHEIRVRACFDKRRGSIVNFGYGIRRGSGSTRKLYGIESGEFLGLPYPVSELAAVINNDCIMRYRIVDPI